MAPAKLDALRRNCLDYVAQRKPLILKKNLSFGDKPLGDKDKNQTNKIRKGLITFSISVLCDVKTKFKRFSVIGKKINQ